MTLEEKFNLKARISNALQTIRPHLNTDGGDIEVVEVKDDYSVLVRWLGNCEHCSMSTMTMRGGIEQTIKMHVPEIKKVTAINGIGS